MFLNYFDESAGMNDEDAKGWLDYGKSQQCDQNARDRASARGKVKRQNVVFTAATSLSWRLSETSWSGSTYLDMVRLIIVAA